MSQKVVYSEEELVLLLRERRETAFDYLYGHYSGALYGVILAIVRDREHASDLLQDAFVKIWRQIHTYDSSKGRLFTWMLNITRNGAIDFLRSKEFRTNIQNQELTEFVSNSVADDPTREDYIGLRALTGTLKEEFRILIEYAYFQGYTQEETAAKLNMPVGTVKTRLRAALQQLRMLMKLLITILLSWI
ncbi:ECF RNA polymerase sigma factor SigK [Ravibacter arvi]|uniref:ECF RNA polymerase sigma factor SigK n=1 Tax=Ravibacter arvi TaxID=2051041 RepID=A0ABP8M0T2_9BACT